MARLSLVAVNEQVKDHTKLIESQGRMIETLDIILVRGEKNQPSISEDVRTIKKFMDRISFWLTAIGLAIVGQAVATTWYMLTHPQVITVAENMAKRLIR